MYQTISVGPLALPTGPILAIFAVLLGLELLGRYGKRFQLYPDVLWNGGLLAVLAGLVVARLWNVYQLWYVYQAEPLLILSPRPGGFALWPGIAAALLTAYAYLVYHRLEPVSVGAAAAVGLVTAGVVRGAADYLTGSVLGIPTALPWAQFYFGELLHPVGLYRLLGLLLLLLLLWRLKSETPPTHVILYALLGYCVTRLVADGFLAEPRLIGPVRMSQLLALLGALGATLLLSQLRRSATRVQDSAVQENAV